MALSPHCAPPKPKGKLLTQTLRIMRLMSLFLFVAIMHVSAKTYSQKVSLSLTDVPLKTVFMEINAQTGYNFVYFDETLAATKNVTLHVTNASIEEVLALCLKDQPVSFTIQNNSIVIKVKQNIQQADTPPIEIHGRITDSLGYPLAGASVFVKGTRKGAITDVKGEFTLRGVSDDKTLVISFTGYVSKEYKANNNSFNITLIRSNNPLDQVQVIAYGTTT
jgi:TonB-dependent starch-binding outer membrane protein SusC